MAKAQKSGGVSWPMLVSAFLLPLLIAGTVFLLSTLDKKEKLKSRLNVVKNELSAAQAASDELYNDFQSEATWIGFVPAAETIASESNGLQSLAWTGSEVSSETFNTYGGLFATKQEVVELLGGYQKYFETTYGAELREKLAALALERQYNLPPSGSVEDITALERNGIAKANPAEATKFFDGASPAEIKGSKAYLSKSGASMTLADILANQIALANMLAESTKVAGNRLQGQSVASKQINDARALVAGNTAREDIETSADLPVNDIAGSSEKLEEMKDQWSNIAAEVGNEITRMALDGALKKVHEGIADDINAVRNSTKRYNRLLTGEAAGADRKLGKHYTLNSTKSVDSTISFYDRTSKIAQIRVGSDLNAHPGMRFEIWSRDDNGYYQRKGVLEIIRVLDRHFSSAIVIAETPGLEIKTSDDLINRIWENGKYVRVGLLGKNWGGEDTFYERKELLQLLKNLGVPAENVPNVNTDVIVVGGRPDADTTDGINTHDTKILLQELSKVQLEEADIRIYLDPR